MKLLDLREVSGFVSENIVQFHETKLKRIAEIKLKDILRKKNPYLFKAKNMERAQDLITAILDAYLSSSEEKIFGDFLEALAIFISSKTCGGEKSASTGIDFEFTDKNNRYLVSVKSGPNWGNNQQQRKQQEDFEKAVRTLKQSRHISNVQAVLGICYGKTKPGYLRGYWKLVGQSFWYFISGNRNLYTDIIEPLGYRSVENNEEYRKKKDALTNLLTGQFMQDFCVKDGQIDWVKLVKFNSGNIGDGSEFPLGIT